MEKPNAHHLLSALFCFFDTSMYMYGFRAVARLFCRIPHRRICQLVFRFAPMAQNVMSLYNNRIYCPFIHVCHFPSFEMGRCSLSGNSIDFFFCRFLSGFGGSPNAFWRTLSMEQQGILSGVVIRRVGLWLFGGGGRSLYLMHSCKK